MVRLGYLSRLVLQLKSCSVWHCFEGSAANICRIRSLGTGHTCPGPAWILPFRLPRCEQPFLRLLPQAELLLLSCFLRHCTSKLSSFMLFLGGILIVVMKVTNTYSSSHLEGLWPHVVTQSPTPGNAALSRLSYLLGRWTWNICWREDPIP